MGSWEGCVYHVQESCVLLAVHERVIEREGLSLVSDCVLCIVYCVLCLPMGQGRRR